VPADEALGGGLVQVVRRSLFTFPPVNFTDVKKDREVVAWGLVLPRFFNSLNSGAACYSGLVCLTESVSIRATT